SSRALELRSLLRASERSGALAEVPPEAAGKVTLVAEPAVERDLAQRNIRFLEQPLRPFQPPLQQIGVRRGSDRLFECPGAMAPPQSGDLRQRLQRDVLGEMRVDMIAHAAQRARGQAAAGRACVRLRGGTADDVESRTRVLVELCRG